MGGGQGTWALHVEQHYLRGSGTVHRRIPCDARGVRTQLGAEVRRIHRSWDCDMCRPTWFAGIREAGRGGVCARVRVCCVCMCVCVCVCMCMHACVFLCVNAFAYAFVFALMWGCPSGGGVSALNSAVCVSCMNMTHPSGCCVGMQTYAAWTIDYLKEDSCNSLDEPSTAFDQVHP